MSPLQTARRCFRTLCLALPALAGLPALAASELRIVTEELPPYNMTQGGQVTGMSTEVVQAVLKDVGMPAPAIQSMPWARAYDIALNTENVLIYSITRTPQREKLFKWVGVIAPTQWYLFSRTGRSLPAIKSVEEARKHQIATVNEDVGEQYLVSKGFVIGKNLQSSNKYEFNYDKLRGGRVDLWVANDLVAHYLSRRAGDDPAQVLVRALPLPDLGGSDGLYMAFSLKTPDAVVERFRAGLEAVRRSGRHDALRRKWL
jgi:polar amino acid transport system substrate-binding protein